MRARGEILLLVRVSFYWAVYSIPCSPWTRKIAVIAVAPTDRASFVNSYAQTKQKGQYNRK